jgi:hypothetical protein
VLPTVGDVGSGWSAGDDAAGEDRPDLVPILPKEEGRLMCDMTSSEYHRSFILSPCIFDAHDSTKTKEKHLFAMIFRRVNGVSSVVVTI